MNNLKFNNAELIAYYKSSALTHPNNRKFFANLLSHPFKILSITNTTTMYSIHILLETETSTRRIYVNGKNMNLFLRRYRINNFLKTH